MKRQYFGPLTVCIADGEIKKFTDGYDLDATYLGAYRPKQIRVQFVIMLGLQGRVEGGPNGMEDERVVIISKYGENRVPRTELGAQWKRDEEELVHFVLAFRNVRDKLTDRKCIWVRPGKERCIAHFNVHPREFTPNESITELLEEAKECITDQLLQMIEPA